MKRLICHKLKVTAGLWDLSLQLHKLQGELRATQTHKDLEKAYRSDRDREETEKDFQRLEQQISEVLNKIKSFGKVEESCA